MNLYCQEKRDDSMMAKEGEVKGKGGERSQKLEVSKADNSRRLDISYVQRM